VSDRTRSRWGRRIPYIFLGAIPLGVSFIIMWTPPTGDAMLTAVYFVVTIFVFDTLLSLLTMAYNALYTEISQTPQERSGLAAWREVSAVIALLLAFILAPILSEEVGFWQMGVVIGALTAAGYMVSVWGSQEDPSRLDEEKVGLVESLKITLKNRPFRWYLGANIAKEFNFVILAATLPFWRKYALNIQEAGEVFGTTIGAGDQEAILLAVPFLLAIPTLWVWKKVTPRLGARVAWMWANLLFIPGLVIMFLANDFYIGLLGTTLITPGLAGFMMLPIVLLSDVIDYDARVVGKHREGIYFGINGAIVKLAFSFQGFLFALSLDSAGYDPRLATQPDDAVNVIRFLMALSPVIACVLGAIFLYFFRIPDEGRPTMAGTETHKGKRERKVEIEE